MKKIILFISIGILFFSPLFCKSKKSKGDEYMKENENVRIQNVMAKIRRGEDVQVVALGGSITTGFNANPSKEKGWAGLFGQWLSDFADEYDCNLRFANEGVSGTDSAFGVARLEDHVLKLNPDLVILEYAMNDQWLQPEVRQRTYEGIIRRIMNNTDTAILALFVNERKSPYPSNQSEQQKICEYYHIPYMSWKDTLFENDKNASFEPFFDGEETVHPNNKGHDKISEFLENKWQSIWDTLPENDSEIPSSIKELPSPLVSDDFENAIYYHNANLKPKINSGWEQNSPVHSEWVSHGAAKKGWETNVSGAEMTFEITGKSIGITYCESDQFRDAIAWVEYPDGTEGKRIPLNCYVSYRKGYLGWAYKELVHENDAKKFVVHIQCSKRAPKSAAGKFCNITGILVTK